MPTEGHRYERNSILLTTNKALKDWNTVFPNATRIAALLGRLTHHADITLIEGTSCCVRESQLEAAAHKKNLERSPPCLPILIRIATRCWISIAVCPTRRAA